MSGRRTSFALFIAVEVIYPINLSTAASMLELFHQGMSTQTGQTKNDGAHLSCSARVISSLELLGNIAANWVISSCVAFLPPVRVSVWGTSVGSSSLAEARFPVPSTSGIAVEGLNPGPVPPIRGTNNFPRRVIAFGRRYDFSGSMSDLYNIPASIPERAGMKEEGAEPRDICRTLNKEAERGRMGLTANAMMCMLSLSVNVTPIIR